MPRKTVRKSVRSVRKPLGYRIYNPKNPEQIKLLRSFNNPDEIYGGQSFMQKYPFILAECIKNNVSLMTFDEFIVFKSKTIDRNRLREYAEDKSDSKEEIDMIGDSTIPIGINDRKFKIYKEAILDGYNHIVLTPDRIRYVKAFIREFYDKSSSLCNLITKGKFKDLYDQTIGNINIEEFGFGNAQDCLRNQIFKQYCKDNLNSRLNDICKRDGKALIKDDYINGIIEANIETIVNNDDDEILVCLVNNADNKIISFVSAQSNPTETNDIIGQLICTSQGTVGLGKLQMASTLLLARDSNVSFVFIQAIQGYFGVQAGLYSKLGFETNFQEYPEIMDREFAIRELTQEKYNYLREGGGVLGILKRPSSIYNIGKVLISQSTTLLPMWIYAPSINTKCMENVITRTGWDCRIGDYGGEGGLARYLTYVPFSQGSRMQRLASQASKISGRDFSHARESYLASIEKSPSPDYESRRRTRSSKSRSPFTELRQTSRRRDRSRERDRTRERTMGGKTFDMSDMFDLDTMKSRKF